MSIEVGQRAPKFKMYDTEKIKHLLEDYKGRNVVLLFFPFAFTTTCTQEMSKMRDENAMYGKLSADVVGVSVDSLFTLKKWKEELHIPFTLLSDFNKDVSRAYESIYEDWGYGYKGVSKRASFVIDKDGYIRYKEILENGDHLPNFDAINAVLKKL